VVTLVLITTVPAVTEDREYLFQLLALPLHMPVAAVAAAGMVRLINQVAQVAQAEVALDLPVLLLRQVEVTAVLIPEAVAGV
jgi:hypothetical protein